MDYFNKIYNVLETICLHLMVKFSDISNVQNIYCKCIQIYNFSFWWWCWWWGWWRWYHDGDIIIIQANIPDIENWTEKEAGSRVSCFSTWWVLLWGWWYWWWWWRWWWWEWVMMVIIRPPGWWWWWWLLIIRPPRQGKAKTQDEYLCRGNFSPQVK